MLGECDLALIILAGTLTILLMAHVKSQLSERGASIGTYEPALDAPFYEGLIIATLQDVALTCNQSDSELRRDIEEIRHRSKNEGISFLTRTLPLLGKSLDKALANGTALTVNGFKTAKSSKLPLFMGDYFKQVFSADGLERSDASQQAVMAIRQISYLFYKLNLPFTEEQKNETIQLFLDTDSSCINSMRDLALDHDTRSILLCARLLVCRVLGGVDPVCPDNFRPRHGPGAVATGEKSWEKPIFTRYYQRLADQFPYDQWFYYNSSHLCDDLVRYLDLEEVDAGTAKVVLVPKDSRGPRLISCEPLEYQWIQQGLMRTMVKAIETHKFTAGLVNFADQTVNQRLALESSINGRNVTLDMKEASDRVSLALVKALFPPRWFDKLFACRSDKTMLPDGRVVYLKKFAPMGSAVCFPVEALIFWALSTATIQYHKRTFIRGNPREEGVYVYGDDIIVPAEAHGWLLQYLPKFGLLFNQDKCCTGRFFRESCGVDAYKGVIVTPLRVRPVWTSRLVGTEFLSYVALHNAANDRGFFHLCDYLAGKIQSIRRTPYSNRNDCEAVALVDCRKCAIQENKRLGFKTRVSTRTCNLEVYSWMARTRVKHTSLPGWAEMQRVASLSAGGPPKGPFVDWRHEASKLLASGLAPVTASNSKPSHLWERWVDDVTVTAYQYPVPRRVSLSRGWAEI